MRNVWKMIRITIAIAILTYIAIILVSNWKTTRSNQVYQILSADQGRTLTSDRQNTYYFIETDAGLDIYAIDRWSHSKRLLYAHTDRKEGREDFVLWPNQNENWLLLAIGTYTGEKNRFDGGIYRIAKDGSTASMLTDRATDYYYVVGDWVYANCVDSKLGEYVHESKGESFRINTNDGTVEDTGERFPYIVYGIDQKIIYSGYGVSSDKRLRVYDVKMQTDTLLYDPSAVIRAQANQPGYSHITYGFISPWPDTFEFSVMAWGYVDGDPESGYIMHEETYRVRYDGTELERVER